VIAVRYHEATKHHFNRFARSLGYLDWATQPDPFRRYDGAPLHYLPRPSSADPSQPESGSAPLSAHLPFSSLYEFDALPRPIDDRSIGEFLRCSMGLSAWKQYGQSRWALRVNPSSGNLHPTEAWIVNRERVWHYAPKEHALEERCVLDSPSWKADRFLVALTSIIWREAWKYGERAFRYCQHDVGHAIGTLRFAAALLGWRLHLLPEWSDAQIAALLGLNRAQDYADVEREEPECIAVVGRDPGFGSRDSGFDPNMLVAAARAGSWLGRANRLSSDRVEWPIIDEVAAATRYPGPIIGPHRFEAPIFEHNAFESRIPNPESRPADPKARAIILQRRSALSFDPRGVLRRDALFGMLDRLRPGSPPWDAIHWPAHVHLVLFIHRVQDVTPGIYAYLRDAAALCEWQTAMRPEFLWESAAAPTRQAANLFLLVPIDARRIANRISCDQDIAEDGFLSLAMIARLQQPLREQGEWFYRRLFWECGLIGQVLYLEAEAAGARATGIGCYYDDPVHELLGLSGHAWQCLYHFSMGLPVEDTRLTSEPGYGWEVVTPNSLRMSRVSSVPSVTNFLGQS
jgi:SagB-type dehydrogenase family enzyme